MWAQGQRVLRGTLCFARGTVAGGGEESEQRTLQFDDVSHGERHAGIRAVMDTIGYDVAQGEATARLAPGRKKVSRRGTW